MNKIGSRILFGKVVITTVFVLTLVTMPSLAAAMLVPTGQQVFPAYASAVSPVTGGDPSLVKPISTGPGATGGETISVQIGLEQFSGPVDIYFAVYLQPIDPANIYLKTSNSYQLLSQGYVPWKNNQTGPVAVTLSELSNIPVSALTDGTYTLFLLVTPAGKLDAYYLWSTSFIKTQAYGIAEKIENAMTADTKYNSILDVMRSVRVGVYSGEGEQIVKGAERAVGDFYLYDFEVDIMAQSMVRKDSWGVKDITDFINGTGIFQGTLTDDDLRSALKGLAQSALQAPSDPKSVAPLLIRELGLRQDVSYDMLVDVPADARFDALQRWLIVGSILLPVLQEMGPATVSASSSLAEMSQGIIKKKDVPAASCGGMTFSPDDKWVVPKMALNTLTLGLSTQVSQVVDLLHSISITPSISITSTVPKANYRTHYGHESPGEEIKFGIKIEMLYEKKPDVKCGWMAGMQFPEEGPLAGVPIKWTDANFQLTKHGQIICNDPGCTSTGTDGVATLTFKPKNEKNPGVGSITSKTGNIQVECWLPDASNYYWEGYSIPWTVEYHEGRAYKGTVKTSSSSVFTSASGEVTWAKDDSHVGVLESYKPVEGSIKIIFDANSYAKNSNKECFTTPVKLETDVSVSPKDGALLIDTRVLPYKYMGGAGTSLGTAVKLSYTVSCPSGPNGEYVSYAVPYIPAFPYFNVTDWRLAELDGSLKGKSSINGYDYEWDLTEIGNSSE